MFPNEIKSVDLKITGRKSCVNLISKEFNFLLLTSLLRLYFRDLHIWIVALQCNDWSCCWEETWNDVIFFNNMQFCKVFVSHIYLYVFSQDNKNSAFLWNTRFSFAVSINGFIAIIWYITSSGSGWNFLNNYFRRNS